MDVKPSYTRVREVRNGGHLVRGATRRVEREEQIGGLAIAPRTVAKSSNQQTRKKRDDTPLRGEGAGARGR